MKFANSKTRTDKDLPFKRASQTKSCIWQNKTLKYNVNRPAPVYRNQVKCDSALYNGFNSQVSPAQNTGETGFTATGILYKPIFICHIKKLIFGV